MDRKIKVLHIVGAMYPGGMENFIMNIYEKIDRKRFQFDFAVHAIKKGGYDMLIKEMGGKVFVLPRMMEEPVGNLKELKKIINAGEYDVVIRHTANALVAPQILVAKKQNVVTVCHSHNETDPQKLLHYLGRLMLVPATDVRLACSENAGRWMYGKKDFQVINNGIDIDRFSYDKEKRQRIIDEFGLGGRHIYGHIANFIASKNHKFLMEIFKEIADIDTKAVLICLGEGELKAETEKHARELGIQDKVIFTGVRHDPEDFMAAFDVMLFPSFFEGLPLTLIEAQISALPILMSDSITPDVVVTEGLVHAKSLSDSDKSWAEEAVSLARAADQAKIDADSYRICQRESVREHGYDLEQLVTWYEEFLEGLVSTRCQKVIL